MYEHYYGLSGLPFQLTPDSRFFYASPGHRRALSHLVYGLEQQEGFVVITGEVGAGKTTLVELLWAHLDRGAFTIARVNTTLVSGHDLLRLVGAGFGVEEASDKASLIVQIESRLRALRVAKRRALLVVDEVQGLALAGLEELRMISNLADQSRPLLQIILLGQPEFRQTLARPQLNQLRQRVLASYHLGPLSADETRAYIEHRLAKVGWRGRPHFEAMAFLLIHRHTGGIPRKINRLCSRLLLQGALQTDDLITAVAVEETAAELESDIGAETASTPAEGEGGRIEALQSKLERLFDFLGVGRGG
jgi:putative secretion ATPase (PEP-CTERM system associated)